jgi:hypothetical protein
LTVATLSAVAGGGVEGPTPVLPPLPPPHDPAAAHSAATRPAVRTEGDRTSRFRS